MKLYFENSYGESRPIAECANEQEVYKAMHAFIDEHNKHRPKDKQFKWHYTRTWEEKGEKWYDVGSHTEFFHHPVEVKL